jgi:signal transduction histidine kinase
MPDTHTRALAARRVAPLCLLVGLGGALVLLHDGAAGLNLWWERQFGPLLALLYISTALLLWWRPRWLDAVMGTTLACTGAYFLGVIQEAARLDTPEGLYAVGANAQFMPLIYVGAFVSLRRGALCLSGALYLALVALYGALRLSAPPEGLFKQFSTHTWTVLLLVHPACILALQHITALRGRLSHAEHEAHAGKERFLAMLSHEIRSPLQTMLGSIDLLALRLHDEPAQRAIDRLRRSATQLEAHLRDVTEYTRLDNPEWQLHEEDTDLAGLLREVCDQLAPLAEHKGLTLRYEVPDANAGPLGIQRVDPVRLRQVLGNLVSNAIKYTPDGEVCVRAALMGSPQGHTDLRLEVEDTGIGIDPAELHRIFEPHVRLEAPGNERVAGSGLGLAVVQRLVQRLGGRILVDSLPGQGSRFILTLPLPPAPPQRQSGSAVT